MISRYLAKNKIVSFVGFYFLLSAVLNSVTEIDICIPCIWKSIFGFNCPGCGLTASFISILELNFKKALESNWLIFVILPFVLYYLKKDFVKFTRQFNEKQNLFLKRSSLPLRILRNKKTTFPNLAQHSIVCYSPCQLTYLDFFVAFLIKQKSKEEIYETDNILMFVIIFMETDYKPSVIQKCLFCLYWRTNKCGCDHRQN